VPWPLELASLVLVPLAAMVLLAGLLVGLPGLLLLSIQSEAEDRGRALSRCVALVSSAALLYLAVGVAAPELRLRRLARATAALAPAVERYAAARAAGRLTTPPPVLRVRGCSALTLDAPGDGSWKLSAICPGRLGQPDELLYRPGGGPDSDNVRRLGGGWVYVWD
ncbi:MAG TPA: hypothetical protein VKA84_03215, partial [Gemmatimonadaceae bacterium]|nr:hypothetical protein [Gemmatimonadaceae bacterium]